MEHTTDTDFGRLIERLDAAVMDGRVAEADEAADTLFRLHGGSDELAAMPEHFIENLKTRNVHTAKERRMKPKSVKRIVYIAAAAAVVTALSITAVATDFFGVRDMVIRDDASVSASAPMSDKTSVAEGGEAADTPIDPPKNDLIVLQGYPDSPEFKAIEEWRIFCSHYDEDGSIIAEVGNDPNEYTERYPMYLVYSKDMADKLEEIIAKYGLTLHETITFVEGVQELIGTAETGDFLSGSAAGMGRVGGYVYNDGSFHYDGEVALQNGKIIDYQFGNYVKGTFSDVYLNVGDVGSYREWQYTTASGVEVSLALGETKALVIANLENSFVSINVLTGSAGSDFGSSAVTENDLEAFADLFDFSVIG